MGVKNEVVKWEAMRAVFAAGSAKTKAELAMADGLIQANPFTQHIYLLVRGEELVRVFLSWSGAQLHFRNFNASQDGYELLVASVGNPTVVR